MKARIIGTGSYLPETIRTNKDIEQMVDTSDEWIRARTGIRERRIAADNEQTSDLAVKAARKAMDMAGVSPEEIDFLVVGTITGDLPWPATACLVQEGLGLKNAFAYDVSAACSGFVFALDAAVQQIESGHIRKALVVGAECLSRIIDWQDRNTCILFGDGAGAVVLEGQDGDHGVLSTHLHSDGSYWELLHQPGFGTRTPATEQGILDRIPYLKMAGNEVFKVAVRSLTEVAKEALEANSLTADQIDMMIPHQANLRILEATAKRLKMREDQVYVNVDRFGNTSGASIPIALDEANRKGLIKENDILLFDAFGGGFTWGSAVVRW
ncbi:beta-ketoacyl-ACP synthase III [Geothermobacter hydrogeniphilus]|uniref:Beta-ketoacyl-[acyl-carrier-protein] synthase III n=1 Tax=Geothermobacter hydrogeniphilus TaxID=1969733 RepID=A0A1X0YEQ4_9BACT|nr:beta-ketoacyl-ACP synthase III [Geothermobacter hydrogeniphilus]ORJ63563.1 3-oxoacyl-ACP synthase [Geothermobacter hydrogeniphilus]